jgi:hypothetical protein
MGEAEFTRSLTAADCPSHCVAALPDRAMSNSTQYGFKSFTDTPLRLVLPIATIRQA